MRKTVNMADPLTSMRALVQGESIKIRYKPSGNDGDHTRGQAFYEWESMFPLSVRVQDAPSKEHLSGAGVDVMRDPSVQMTDFIRLTKRSPFAPAHDLLIVDGSAPWWGGEDWELVNDAPWEQISAQRDAIKKITPFADMIVVPWADYAEYLRDEQHLPAMFVPDYRPGMADSLDNNVMGWAAVMQAAILRPFINAAKTPEKTS